MKAPPASTVERITAALEWVEQNLASKITVTDVARRACYSPFHFHRLFTGLAGEPLMEFVRRRRMTRAAQTLRDSNRRILDIAFDSGFDSQEAFTRAFKTFSGCTPGRYRRDPSAGTVSLTGPLDTERLASRAKGASMEPKFTDLPAFDVVGVAGRFVCGKTEGIPRLWEDFCQRWSRAGHAFPSVSYGICYDESDGQSSDAPPFTYLAAFPATAAPAPEDLETRTIPSNRYAVFTHRGPVMKIQDTYALIFGTWLPTSGYRRADGPDFELYDERFDDKTMTGEVDIYLPIQETVSGS